MFSPCTKKKGSLDNSYFLWMYLCNLFFILQEAQKVVFGSVPYTGFLLVWMYLATVVSPAPLVFPSGTAKNHFEMSPDGSYLFFYDTGPGQHQSFRQEKRNKGGTISGTYGYVDPIGVLHITDYVADRKGYRASVEIYEPVHQILNGPALIVGPLPADLRSPEERASRKSVFDKYEFPLEPFESLKTESPSQIYSSVMTNIKSATRATTSTINTSTSFISRVGKSDDKSHIKSELESNETLPFTDINTLEKQLRSLSDLLKEDPLLLIGPLPGDLPTLLSFNFNDNSLSETSRKFRSSINLNQTDSSSNITNEQVSDLKLSEFDVVVPSFNDLNFVDKDLISKGEHDINSFLAYPSSDLLQGSISSLEIDDNDEDRVDNDDNDNIESSEISTSKSPESRTPNLNETIFDSENELSLKEVKQPKAVKGTVSLRNILPSHHSSEGIKPVNERAVKSTRRPDDVLDDFDNSSKVRSIVTNVNSTQLLDETFHNNPLDISPIESTSFPNNERKFSLGKLMPPTNSELTFSRNFTSNGKSEFSRNFTSNGKSEFSRNFTSNGNSEFPRNFTSNSNSEFPRNLTSNIHSKFPRNFTSNSNSEFTYPRNLTSNGKTNTDLQGKRNSNNAFLRTYLYPGDKPNVSGDKPNVSGDKPNVSGDKPNVSLQKIYSRDQNNIDFTKDVAKINNTGVISPENNGTKRFYGDRNGTISKTFSGRKTRRKEGNSKLKHIGIDNTDLGNMNNLYKTYTFFKI